MKLYYYCCETGNFGDDLNPWLWSRLIPELLNDDERTIFVGIGTLLNHRVPYQPAKVVFGSGAGYGNRPEIDERWHFCCVRGPLTAQALGLDASLAVTDAAALLATIELPSVVKDGGTAFIPHHQSALNADWAMICRQLGLRYIDPSADVETVMHEIRRSTSIITESMHGAILADTFRVPWKAVSCYEHILDFKWQDWCASLGMNYRPDYLPGIWDADRNVSRVVRLKNSVKRSLGSLGVVNSNWSPVSPAKSSRSEIAHLLDQFVGVLSNCEFGLSDQGHFEAAVDGLQDALINMKKNYVYG